MLIKDPIELLYLALMLRWENTAPASGKLGILDGFSERNSQIARMVYLLKKIAAGSVDGTCRLLELNSRRTIDGESYISKHNAWMKEPREISGGWYFEGCTSLDQKLVILGGLNKLGLSSRFVSCSEAFVSGQSVRTFLPSLEEQERIVAEIEQTYPLVSTHA